MKKHFRLSWIFLLGFFAALQVHPSAADAKGGVPAAPEYLHVYRHSETSLRIIWKRVKRADGYAVYRYDPGSGKYRRIKIQKGNKKSQIIDSGLKTNRVYRYRVRAYCLQAGKRRCGAPTYDARAKTYRRKCRIINAGKAIADRKVTLGITMSKKMEVYVKPARYGSNKKKKALTQKVRWISSDPAVAAVASDGTVTAGTKAGTCKVYAVAHNGNRRKITVKVKNYAFPKSYDGYSGADPIVNELLSDYKKDVCSIAYYFTVHRPTSAITIQLDESGRIVQSPGTVDLSAIQEHLDRLFYQFPANLRIEASDIGVQYVMESYNERGALTCRRRVEYYYGDDYKQFMGIIAEHWRWHRFIPGG